MIVENAKNTTPNVTISPPQSPGSPVENASDVSGAPVSPLVQTPVVTITSAVNVTTTSVSRNVCVIETRPWRTGWLVFAAAAAIPPVPSPDSFEKMPRATPYWIAAARPAPAKPPAAAVPVNASLKISPIDAGTSVMCTASTQVAPRMYTITMNGTKNAVKRPIDLMPPRITAPAAIASTRPIGQRSMPKRDASSSATVFDCTILPMPNAAIDAAIDRKSDV